MDNLIKQIDDIIESFCQFNITEKQWFQISNQIQTIIDLIKNSRNEKLKEELLNLPCDHIPYRYIIQLIKIYLPYSHLHERPSIQLSKEQMRILVSIVNRQYVNGYCLFNRWSIILNTLFIWRCHKYNAKLFTLLLDVFDNFFGLMVDSNKPNDLSSIFGYYQKEGYRRFLEKRKQNRNTMEYQLTFGLSTNIYTVSFYSMEKKYLNEYKGQDISSYLNLWSSIADELNDWFILPDKPKEKDVIDQIDDYIEDLCEFNPYDPTGEEMFTKIQSLLNFVENINDGRYDFKVKQIQYDDKYHRKQLFDFLEQYLPYSRLSSRKFTHLNREQKIGCLGTLYPILMYPNSGELPYQTITSNTLFIWKHHGYRLDQFKRIKKALLSRMEKYPNQTDIMLVFNYNFEGYPWSDKPVIAENYPDIGWIEKGILNAIGSCTGDSSQMIVRYLEETSGRSYTDHLELWKSIGEKLIQVGLHDVDNDTLVHVLASQKRSC